MDDLLSHVSTFAPDCVAITETWLTINTNDDFLRIPTYDFFRCDRKSRRGGGVRIWMKHCLRATYFKCIDSKYFQCISVFSDIINMLILSIYIPPDSCNNVFGCRLYY